jgi:hypothetical protein
MNQAVSLEDRHCIRITADGQSGLDVPGNTPGRAN